MPIHRADRMERREFGRDEQEKLILYQREQLAESNRVMAEQQQKIAELEKALEQSAKRAEHFKNAWGMTVDAARRKCKRAGAAEAKLAEALLDSDRLDKLEAHGCVYLHFGTTCPVKAAPSLRAVIDALPAGEEEKNADDLG